MGVVQVQILLIGSMCYRCSYVPGTLLSFAHIWVECCVVGCIFGVVKNSSILECEVLN